MIGVERHELALAQAHAIAECEARRPGLAPQRVQHVDPPRVGWRAPAREQAIRHLAQRFADVRQILLADHGALQIAVRRRSAEGRVGERDRDREIRRARDAALAELLQERRLEAERLRARRFVELLAVLEPLPVAHLDRPALHLEEEDAPIGDRDDEVALTLEAATRANAQRVPRGPAVGKAADQGGVELLLRATRGGARAAAGEDASGHDGIVSGMGLPVRRGISRSACDPLRRSRGAQRIP